MKRITKGEWVKYRGGEGWVVTKKVLDKRPDGKLVVGEHDNDPDPETINPERIFEKL